MRQNKVTSIPMMLALAVKIVAGLQQFAAILGIAHITKPVVDAVTLELSTARDNYDAAKAELITLRAAQTALLPSVRAYLTSVREVLKPTLGNQYSQAWDVTGFRGSLAVPKSADELHGIVTSLKTFFTNNPGLEVLQLNVTAARADALLVQLDAVQSAIVLQGSKVNDLITVRDQKADKFTATVRSLIHELSLKLAPLDARWLAFGFNKPGASATPEIPGKVSAILVGPSAASVKWSSTARAEYYRVWMRIIGLQETYSVVGSPGDLDFTLEGLPANSTIDIVVTAVNNGGESAFSEVVRVITA